MLKHSVLIDESLYNEINEYCKANGIKASDFCNKELRRAIAIEKYGDTPFGAVINEFKPVADNEKQLQQNELSEALTDFRQKLISEQVNLEPEISQLVDENFMDLLVDTPIKTVEQTEEKMTDIMAVPTERLNQNDKPQPRKRRL